MSDPESTRLTPPMRPGAVTIPQSPSTWPTAIGTIAIVFGAAGVLVGVWSALSPYIIGKFGFFMLEGQLEAIEQTLAWTVASSVLGALVAVLLIAGGIALSRRAHAAWGLLKLWAILKMISTVFVSIVGYHAANVQLTAIQNDPNFQRMAALPFTAFSNVAIGVGLAWGWALPAFILIWFSRKKIKAEMAGWA